MRIYISTPAKHYDHFYNLQIDYEYLGETFVKYLPVEFGYTDLLHESSILGATVTEKALISGVVRAENPH